MDRRLPALLQHFERNGIKLSWVLILGGINDLGYGADPDAVHAGLLSLYAACQQHGARVLAMTCLQTGGSLGDVHDDRTKLNELIRGTPAAHDYVEVLDLVGGERACDVAVTSGSSPDVAEVILEEIATEKVLGLILLRGYSVYQDDSVAKYSRKHRRFTIRLEAAITEPPAAPYGEDNGAPEKPNLSTNSPVKPSSSTSLTASPVAPWSSPPAGTGNSFGLLDNDDVSDDEGAEAEETEKKKKKKKKKKKGKKAGSGGGEQGEPDASTANGNHADGSADAAAGGDSSGDEAEAAPAAGGEGATAAAKKKKKKKKKGTATVAAVAAPAEEMAEVSKEAPPAHTSPPPPTSRALPSPPEPLPPAPNAAPTSASASAPASAPIHKHASRAMSVDMVEDFGEEKVGSFEVGASLEHDPLLGPAVHHSLGKAHVKGEDKSLEAPTNSWCVKGLDARFAERAVGPEAPGSPAQLAAEGYLPANAAEDSPTGSGGDEAELERARVAAAQDALISRLPKALHAGFVQCDEDVNSRHKSSGTTATLAVQVGWELLVANVGDSLAYLDTGSEIVVISTNHRVSESTEEQERIIKAGGRIKPAMYGEDDLEGEGSGSTTPQEGQQLRVWPGGINMTRTIGDDAAKGLLIAEPSVRQVSLPVTGARLIIASDGLWDAVNAKTIIGQLRTSNAREAASKAAVYAMRHKKHDDDVTVVVADFVPRQSDTHVPGLLKRASGPAVAALAALAAAGLKEERAVQSWRPLDSHSESWRERHRAHRQRAAAYLHELELAEKAEAEAAEELERQRRMAVAPAAGTAGVGTAVRLPAVSDTYRELAELKVPLEALKDLNDEPASEENDWTQVDAKKRKDAGFDVRKELIRAARPGEGRRARSPGSGGREERPTETDGGRRERRDRGGGDRDRRQPRRARDGGTAAIEATVAAPAALAAASHNAEAEVPAEQPQQPQPVDQQQQQAPRAERRERGDRRDRGGRGGRRREGGGTGAPRNSGSAISAEAADTGSAASAAPASTMPPGVVKTSGYLCVPRSLLTGGSGPAVSAAAGPTPAPPVVPAVDATGIAVDAGNAGKPRWERGPRAGARNRREGAAPSSAAPQDGTGGPSKAGDPASVTADDSAAYQRPPRIRRPREQDAAAAAAAVLTGLPTAPAAGHSRRQGLKPITSNRSKYRRNSPTSMLFSSHSCSSTSSRCRSGLRWLHLRQLSPPMQGPWTSERVSARLPACGHRRALQVSTLASRRTAERPFPSARPVWLEVQHSGTRQKWPLQLQPPRLPPSHGRLLLPGVAAVSTLMGVAEAGSQPLPSV
ncbi:hypothetical protein VOLCADRAFT_121483 [Volvox carteri f. nagariensis]|uniref:PPM-type phosphatase domain-containing protein n=1 Tax=Volvox carteri f. nagariensis TaxID=3068 RepID=D8UBL1_VOLCA|nr:uncharacterized protein VOLCADRAFT_121483 [Volvox carteri f. nagariensis]EFJ42787.1 hypothetical protein VOLCADRAFT_121483 [Volvox carteri f. nagariensis]|eukprot:XP_002956047.1 hypothetical protein VOLCADRAFT_121483 [Volvox carteri f. nagariensis]